MSSQADQQEQCPYAPQEPQPPEPQLCPLAEVDDRYQEAHYFIERMMHEYHEPQPFRWNLNAFLQALRNVTFVLQKQLAAREGFASFWQEQQKRMRADELLRKFVEGRNVVVKERNLLLHSKASIGVFNDRRLRVAISIELPPWASSREVLERYAPKLALIDADRSVLWEEYGVEREWIASELGEENVLVLCDRAWVRLSEIITAAHDFIAWKCAVPTGHHHTPEKCNLLTETDVHPSLAGEWEWT